MRKNHPVFSIVFILFFVISQYGQTIQRNWYCDERLQLNLQVGTVTEVIKYGKSEKSSIPENFAKNEVEYKTVEIVKFSTTNLYDDEELPRIIEYFVVQSKNSPAVSLNVGEKYLFEYDSFRATTAEYFFIRPNGFFKIYKDALPDIEFLRMAKHSDKSKDILGTNEGELLPAQSFSKKFLNLVKPIYPPKLKKAKISETVKVLVLVDESGTVAKAKAFCEKNQLLGESAEKAALASKFIPTIEDGKRIKIRGIISYNFAP